MDVLSFIGTSNLSMLHVSFIKTDFGKLTSRMKLKGQLSTYFLLKLYSRFTVADLSKVAPARQLTEVETLLPLDIR